jgi:mono/diheme cytochrome c family protein
VDAAMIDRSFPARIADAAQWLVGVAAATAIVLLFTLRGAESGATAEASEAAGLQIYSEHCASCHGADGQGGIGTRLAGVVVALYPDLATEIQIITDGRNAMPPFDERLSTTEIEAVTAYTRTAWE